MHTLLQHISHYLLAFGPLGVFLLSAIDSVGVPLPGGLDILLLGVAADSVKNPSIAWISAVLAIVGSIGGNMFLFTAASHGGRLFGRKEDPNAVPGRFQRWFHRYGLVTVFIPAVTPLIPLPLKVFVISAGAFRTSFARFIGVIVLARSIRFFLEAWLGLQLGRDAQGFLIRNGWTIAGLFLLLALGAVLLVKRAERQPEPEIGRP
jgi:membrane protein YqaA with SNARE-associated domain